jgi:hypothetical protein
VGATANWRGLGLAFLEALEYSFKLDHRSATTIWSHAESQLLHDKYLVMNIDEAQHLFYAINLREVDSILVTLSDWTRARFITQMSTIDVACFGLTAGQINRIHQP